jgi:hypothetical protein
MDDGRTIGARDLILAVFRLAIADYLEVSYGHDEPAPMRHTGGGFRAEAEGFLHSSWADYLGDLIGIEAKAIRRDAEQLNPRDRHYDQAA